MDGNYDDHNDAHGDDQDHNHNDHDNKDVHLRALLYFRFHHRPMVLTWERNTFTNPFTH